MFKYFTIISGSHTIFAFMISPRTRILLYLLSVIMKTAKSTIVKMERISDEPEKNS